MLMDFDYLVSQLYVQHCTFVEIGEGICSLFVELPLNSKCKSKRSLTKEMYFGNCLCSEFRTWQLCSKQLALERPEDCEFEEGIACPDSSARVHRRLCDVTGMSQWNSQCNCSVPLAGNVQQAMTGFRTCYAEPLPQSICKPRPVCGTARCDPSLHGSLYSIKCDRKCKGRQSFCEQTGPATSERRSVQSEWSNWKAITPDDKSNIQQYEAVCLTPDNKPAFDCLGPGLLCCSKEEGDCICEVKQEDGEMKAFRYTITFCRNPEQDHSSIQARSAVLRVQPDVWNRFIQSSKEDDESVSLFSNHRDKMDIKEQTMGSFWQSEKDLPPVGRDILYKQIVNIAANKTNVDLQKVEETVDSASTIISASQPADNISFLLKPNFQVNNNNLTNNVRNELEPSKETLEKGLPMQKDPIINHFTADITTKNSFQLDLTNTSKNNLNTHLQPSDQKIKTYDFIKDNSNYHFTTISPFSETEKSTKMPKVSQNLSEYNSRHNSELSNKGIYMNTDQEVSMYNNKIEEKQQKQDVNSNTDSEKTHYQEIINSKDTLNKNQIVNHKQNTGKDKSQDNSLNNNIDEVKIDKQANHVISNNELISQNEKNKNERVDSIFKKTTNIIQQGSNEDSKLKQELPVLNSESNRKKGEKLTTGQVIHESVLKERDKVTVTQKIHESVFKERYRVTTAQIPGTKIIHEPRYSTNVQNKTFIDNSLRTTPNFFTTSNDSGGKDVFNQQQLQTKVNNVKSEVQIEQKSKNIKKTGEATRKNFNEPSNLETNQQAKQTSKNNLKITTKAEDVKKSTTDKAVYFSDVEDLLLNPTTGSDERRKSNIPISQPTASLHATTNKVKLNANTVMNTHNEKGIHEKGTVLSKESSGGRNGPIHIIPKEKPMLASNADKTIKNSFYDEPEPVLKDLDKDTVDTNIADVLKDVMGLKHPPEKIEWKEMSGEESNFLFQGDNLAGDKDKKIFDLAIPTTIKIEQVESSKSMLQEPKKDLK